MSIADDRRYKGPRQLADELAADEAKFLAGPVPNPNETRLMTAENKLEDLRLQLAGLKLAAEPLHAQIELLLNEFPELKEQHELRKEQFPGEI